MNKLETLAEFLEVGTDEIAESNYYDDGFSYGDEEYLVLTDEEADKKAREEIRESLWAFNTEFILEHSVISNYSNVTEIINALNKVQSELCESVNEFVYALIVENFDEFVEDAVISDGRGHFISRYDGNENELNDYYIYRVD